MNSRKILYSLLLAILVSCSSFRSDPAKLRSTHVNYHTLPSPWILSKSSQADISFSNDKDASLIFVNSICKQYESSTLKDLFLNMSGSLSNLKIVEQKILKRKGREALHTNFQSSVDGVTMYLQSILIRKNRCLYDFVLITPKSKLQRKHSQTFNNFFNKTSIK